MQDYLFKNLYKRVYDYFSRNRDWFNQFFLLLEKYDRKTNEFYYVEVERLFLERDEEINKVLDFFKSDKAKGDLNDFCHHTSTIYRKFKNNTLSVDDFKLTSLSDYFKKVKDRTDDFVYFKRKLLQLKVNQYEANNTFYYSFPLIGFNMLQGSIHILFNVEDTTLTELKINAIFRNTIIIFTEFFEQIYFEIFPDHKMPDHKSLSIDSFKNSFLQDLDYPKLYLSKFLDQEEKETGLNTKNNLLKKQVDFKKLREMVVKGNSMSVLSELEKYFIETNKENYISILTIKSELVHLDKDKIKGLISSTDYRVELNKLNYAILKIMNEY